ncbi:MAG: hypothetical protein ACREUX_21260 [Burkholderiales bacterium]
MSGASVVFLPWVRQGLAARIATPDPLTTALPAQAPLGVTLALNGVDIPPVNVRLFGPADVIGIDPRQVVRTEPPAGTTDYESNDLAAVEFDNPDLPWLFTPAAADAQGRLRPWLVLAVVRKQEGVRVRPPRTEPLPVLEIGPPALPAAELPDLAQSWAWTHGQIGTHENAAEETLRSLLASRPELTVSRLLSPRLLAPFTDYIACVVPAFEAGRRAGLGEDIDADAALAPAWTSGAEAPGTIALPVYFHWEFRTAAREDFESIVARLAPRDLTDAVGQRPMDIGAPGFSVPPTITSTILLEGALQPVGIARAPFPDEATKPWQQSLQFILNAANANAAAADAEPVLGPPIYGRWLANRHELGTVATRSWLDDLNLDPRERVVAALGTRVIQDQQEALMAEAWEQAGEMAQANQRLRQMQLSLAIGGRLHARHVIRMNDDDRLWRFASPAQARLVISRASTGAATTMRTMLAASSTPQAVTAAPMRRLSRPRGAISRRAATAVRLAGAAAPTTTVMSGISTLFHLYGATPSIMTFTLPPTRGLVTFDAVTRRLGTQFAAMTYARATDDGVLSAPRRPDFVITPEPAPTIGEVRGTVHGGVLDATVLQPARARRRPGDGEIPDLPDVPEPEPPDPIPPRPRPVDNADAKAFRAAAASHLAVVNPKQPLIFVTPIKRAVLDVATVRPQIRALLDPAPVMRLRMAATIRIAGGITPPAVGPVGSAPVFSQPMSEPLAALSQDWLLPGLERVPVDSVALLTPNQRFIEAFMLGLNVEMARELLWRDFVVNDPRATFFHRFWRTLDPASAADIAALSEWADRRLGENRTAQQPSRQTVLLVRSSLFRRYPGASVYAVPAVKEGSGRKPGAQGDEVHPLFRGSLQPDVTFFGFDLDPALATGDPGWYFVIQQQPTEPRFGFDVGIDFGEATHVPLAAAPAGHALPAGTVWGFNAAHMARILRQLPVRVAIHASELIRV